MSTPSKIIRLDQKETFALMKFIEAEYVSSAMNDVQFAAKAQETLGFELNGGHIARARESLGIGANAYSGQNGGAPVQALALRMDELTKLYNLQQTELEDLRTQVKTIQRSLHRHPLG